MVRQKEFDTEEILDKAIELFWKKGYGNTSIQDLVDYLGIGRGSLYNAFENKHAVFLAALDRYTSRRNSNLLITLTEGSPKEGFRRMFRKYINDILDDTENKGCFLVNATTELASSDPEVAKRVKLGQGQIDDCLTDALRAAKQKGELPRDLDPRALALFFANTMKGLRVMAKGNPSREDLEAVVNTALTVLE